LQETSEVAMENETTDQCSYLDCSSLNKLNSRLIFCNDAGTEAVLIDVTAGTVELSEKYRDRLDDVAKLFWTRVQQIAEKGI
jgi:hypothetical protein